jgi:hypothetical protein
MLGVGMKSIQGQAVLGRLKQYGNIVSSVATWPALIIWWGWYAVVFLRDMVSRAGHFLPAGMRVQDLPCASPLCDFSVFWQAGAMAAHGRAGATYDPMVFLALRKNLFSAQADPLLWFYPPPALLTCCRSRGCPLKCRSGRGRWRCCSLQPACCVSQV